MTVCQLCGIEKQLINSHIIPRQLYKPIRQASNGESPGDQSPRIYTVQLGQKSKQTQSGIQDQSILCRECDNSIGLWDEYGQTFLSNSLSLESYLIDNTSKPIGYKIDRFDYKKLKFFFMSMLWRAAITSHQFFSQVKLGLWEEKLREMILAENPGGKEHFSVIFFKYEGDFSEVMPNPTQHRQDGVNYYRFRFPKYGFLIKVDQRNFHSKLDSCILSPDQPFFIRILQYNGSKEYKQLLDIRDKLPD